MRELKTGKYEMRPLSEFKVTRKIPAATITINGITFALNATYRFDAIYGGWDIGNVAPTISIGLLPKSVVKV